MSVVVTTYNSGSYLPETLESVFAQSHPDVEVIVVDDGSSDDSVEVARSFGDRVRSIARPHEGLGPARNTGIDAATGEYLALLDSDDLWEPDALATQVEVAARNPGSGLIVMDGVQFDRPDGSEPPLYTPEIEARFDADTREVTAWCHRWFVERNRVSCPAQILLPRHVRDVVGPMSCASHGAQDFDYYLRISRAFPVTFHRASLVRWRYRADSMSGDLRERPLRRRVQALQVVADERDAATPDQRAYVDAAYRAHIRAAAGIARAMLLRGDDPNPDDLRLLAHVAPRSPHILAMRAAQVLPRAVRRPLGRLRARVRPD